MMKIEICKLSDLFNDPRYEEVCRHYRQEAGHLDLKGIVDKDKYAFLETNGLLLCARAVSDEQLVGIMAIVMCPSLHNSKDVANVDTLYLEPEYRGHGLQFLRHAIKMARAFGASGIRFSAPAGSRTEQLFDRLFTRSDITYYKSLED